MPRLTCPSCKSVHRVSVLQRSYRDLPCKTCGRPMPVTALEVEEERPRTRQPLSAVLAPLPTLASGAPREAEPEAVEFTTQSFRAPALTAASSAALRSRPCEQCGASFDDRLPRCPLCGAGEAAELPADSPITRELGAIVAQAQLEAGQVACPRCGMPIQSSARKCRHCKRFVAPEPRRGSARSRCPRCGLEGLAPGAACLACDPRASRPGRLRRAALPLAAACFALLLIASLAWLRARERDDARPLPAPSTAGDRR